MDLQAELEMARRHVAQGERHVETQRRIAAQMRELGGSSKLADDLLEEFEAALCEHRAHRDRIEKEMKAAAASRSRAPRR